MRPRTAGFLAHQRHALLPLAITRDPSTLPNMSKRGRLAHVAAALLALSWLDGLTARAGDMRIAGQVVYVSGVPLIDVWVFAIDRHNGDLVAAARSDVRGRVELEVDGTREILVGASSHRFEIQRVVVATKTQFRIVMRVVRDAPGPSSSSWDESVAVAVPAEPKLVGVSAGAIRGRVTDATGVPLAGVRVTAARQTGPLAVKST
ncbi:MAG TPA: carboxypeptidase-like regulatory domain-containing protein, partial [Polyangia bacterium]